MTQIENRAYCIITPSIGSMGGAQLYTLRRVNYLKNKGIKVVVITGDMSNFMLKEQFGNIEILNIPETMYPTFFFSLKINLRVKEVINSFLKVHNPAIIESHTLAAAIYGETSASQINAKHVIYLLNEDKVKKYDGPNFSSFFEFKLNRGELFGVSNMSLEIILSRQLDKAANKYINIPFEKKELDNQLGFEILQNISYDSFIISTLARLEKTYIKVLLDDVIKLAGKYKEKHFVLLVVGGSGDKKILPKLRNKYKSTLNLTILFPGYIYPIPAFIFHKSTIFIGQGTASINSISQGCATAVVDPRDDKTSGFLGIHTNNFGYPDKGIKFPIYELLEKSLLNPDLLVEAGHRGLELFEKEFELNIVMQKFDQEIINSSIKVEYWNFYFRRNLRRILDATMCKVFGIKGYNQAFNMALGVKLFIDNLQKKMKLRAK